MVKRVLMIAFHFPPMLGSSGLQRTLKFTRYLPDHGWQPIVLSANANVYQATSEAQLGEIGATAVVRRAWSLDAARHLSIRGAYPAWLALPDRWASWWLGAVPAGLALIRRYRPDAIWSTFPIATSHLIGLTLARYSGLPWIADFRDSMTEENYPADPRTRRAYRWIERHSVNRCRAAVFTAPGAARMYAERYPEVPAERWRIIENGYDEENFLAAERTAPTRSAGGDRLVLLHSGLLYPSERDPRFFFAALNELRQSQAISPKNLTVVLRASGHDAHLRRLAEQYHVTDLIDIAPSISYHAALAEMLAADGLLVFQAANCNHQIPAKIYEYLRARRPILALTDPAGDTAGALRAAAGATLTRLDNVEDIKRTLIDFLRQLREQRAPAAEARQVTLHSRQARTRELATLLDSLV